jgi:hypothetical protein
VSAASNLVPGDTDGVRDLFVRVGSHTRRVAVGGRGVQPNHAIIFASLAEGGVWLAFVSRRRTSSRAPPMGSATCSCAARSVERMDLPAGG